MIFFLFLVALTLVFNLMSFLVAFHSTIHRTQSTPMLFLNIIPPIDIFLDFHAGFHNVSFQVVSILMLISTVKHKYNLYRLTYVLCFRKALKHLYECSKAICFK